MSVSLAMPARLGTVSTAAASPRKVYGAALIFWLLTRALVLVHQGAWPWMNAFVVAASRGIVVGDWNEAVRPQLPAVLGVPLVLAGASEQQMVAVLYLLASLVQFAAFVVLIRAIFSGRLEAQAIALLVFVLLPFNHSIHHYRDMPVVLASAAIFLLSADFVRHAALWRRASNGAVAGGSIGASSVSNSSASSDLVPAHSTAMPYAASPAAVSLPSASLIAAPPFVRAFAPPFASPPPARRSFLAKRNFKASQDGQSGVTKRHAEGVSTSQIGTEASRGGRLDVTNWPNLWRWLEIGAVMLLGVWSRIEILTFVGMLAVIALLVYRKQATQLAVTYLVSAAVVTGSLLIVYRLENVDLSQAWFYTAHTFLDSTPDSWLSPACQANPTENCREADGLTYFGPADLRAGVLALALNHPLMTLAKSARSAWDNAWVLVGPNLSTFPGTLPFLVVVLGLIGGVREAYRQVPRAAWIVVVAIAAESVLPPLTWAPPHAQYHVALVAAIVILLVPALLALLHMPRARWLALGFFVANAGLSAFRYTRYAGY